MPSTIKSAPPLIAPKLASPTKLFAKEIDEVSDEKLQRWKEIRFLSEEEAAASLNEEELKGYTAHRQQVKDDIETAIELTTMICAAMDNKEQKPKTKGQRKRDKWAAVQQRAADAAAAALMN